MHACRTSLALLQSELSKVSPKLYPVQAQMISILRSMTAASTRQTVRVKEIHDDRMLMCVQCQFPCNEVKEFQEQLKQIQASEKDGHFVVADNDEVLPGDEELNELLSRCIHWSEIVLERYVTLKMPRRIACILMAMQTRKV